MGFAIEALEFLPKPVWHIAPRLLHKAVLSNINENNTVISYINNLLKQNQSN